MSERTITDIQGHVAHVQLNRPDKKNGLDLAMFEALVATGEELAGTPGVRAVVLSGAGGCFCAGLDFQAFMAGGEETAEQLLGRRVGPANLAQRAAWIWQELRAPVIAAVEGVALGGGMQIAAAADLRYAARDARFSVMEIRWGLVPDMGITKTLGPLLRPDVLLELTLTGRMVEATEAEALGLVTRLCDDPVAAALETAALMASRSPDAVERAKAMLRQARDLDVAGAFALESALQREILGQHNQREAVMANFQRRDPVFHDATRPEVG